MTNRTRRAGFTLIELIVVMSLMAIIVSLIVAVAYTASNKQLVATGASNVVGWCKEAQALALRDQKPYGVRLYDNGSGFITGAQLIEQPPDWVGPVGSTISAATTGNTITITGANGVDFSGGFGGTYDANTWPVQPADYLECNGGKVAVISGVSNTATLTCTLPPGDLPWTFTGMADFRIVRKPRIKTGSDPLALPTGVAIDLTTNANYGSPLPTPVNGNIDILFAPTGNVITPGLSGRDIRLWLIDTTQNTNAAATTFVGDQLIVTIAIRTGLVSIQSVNVAPGGPGYANPYSFTQDGRSSGF